MLYFFFSSRRRHTSSYGDWSSDVCSSDLAETDDTASAVYPAARGTGARAGSKTCGAGQDGAGGQRQHLRETFVPGGGAASERSRDRALEFPDRDERQSAGQQGRALIRLPAPRRGRKGRPESVQIQTGHGRREAGAGAGAHRLRVEARVTRRGPGGTSRGFLEFQIVVSGSAGYETKIVGCSEPVGGRAGRRLDRRGNRRFERGDGAGFQSGDCSLLCHRGQTGSVRG